MTNYQLKAIIPPSIAARDAKEQRRKLLEEVRKRRYQRAKTRQAKEQQAYQENEEFREDWGEESRVEAIQLLDVILAEDTGHINAAYQASTHLPRDLTVHGRKSS